MKEMKTSRYCCLHIHLLSLLTLVCLFMPARSGVSGVCDTQISTFTWCSAEAPPPNVNLPVGGNAITMNLCFDMLDADGDQCEFDLDSLSVFQGVVDFTSDYHFTQIDTTYPGSIQITPDAAIATEILNLYIVATVSILNTQTDTFDLKVQDCIIDSSNFYLNSAPAQIDYTIGTGPLIIQLDYTMESSVPAACVYDFSRIRIIRVGNDLVADSASSENSDKFSEFRLNSGQIIIQADAGVAAQSFTQCSINIQVFDNGTSLGNVLSYDSLPEDYFTINFIDSCSGSSFDVSTAIPDLTVYAGLQVSDTQTFTEFKLESELVNSALDCGARTYDMQDSTGASMPWTYLSFDVTDPKTIVLTSDNQADVGGEQVTLSMQLDDLSTTVSATTTFNIVIDNACENVGSYEDQVIPDLVEFAGAGSTASHTMTEWLTNCEASSSTVDCGVREYNLYDDQGVSLPYLSFDATNPLKIDLKSDDPADFTNGLKQVMLRVTFVSYPTLIHEKFFNIRLRGCDDGLFVDPQSFADLQVFAGQGDTATITFTQFMLDYEDATGADCGPRTYIVLENGVVAPSYFTVDQSTMEITLVSQNQSEATTDWTSVALEMSLDSFPLVSYSKAFQILIKDCSTTTFVPKTINDMETWVTTTDAQTFTEFQIQMEVDDPTIDCGAIIYTLSGAIFVYFDPADDKTIILDGMNVSNALLGYVEVTLLVEMEKYPDPSGTETYSHQETFQVWVKDCMSSEIIEQDWVNPATRPSPFMNTYASTGEPKLLSTVFSPSSDSFTFTAFEDAFALSNCPTQYTVRKTSDSTTPSYISIDLAALRITLLDVDSAVTLLDVNVAGTPTEFELFVDKGLCTEGVDCPAYYVPGITKTFYVDIRSCEGVAWEIDWPPLTTLLQPQLTTTVYSAADNDYLTFQIDLDFAGGYADCGPKTYELAFGSNPVPAYIDFQPVQKKITLLNVEVLESHIPADPDGFEDFQLTVSLDRWTGPNYVSYTHEFKVRIYDCLGASFVDGQTFASPLLTTSALGVDPSIYRYLQFMTDFENDAGKPYLDCGSRSYSVVLQSDGTVPSYLTLDTSTLDIILLSLDLADSSLGSPGFDVKLVMSLANWSLVPSYEKLFDIDITVCQITSFSSIIINVIGKQNYWIDDVGQAITLDKSNYVQNPVCEYDYDFIEGTIELNGVEAAMPLYSNQQNPSNPFEYEIVETNDLNNIGTYTVHVYASISDSSQIITDLEIDSYQVIMRDPCEKSMLTSLVVPTTPLETRVIENNSVTDGVQLYDQASLDHDASQEGYLLCADQNYVIDLVSNASNIGDFLTLDLTSGLLTLNSNAATDYDGSPYTVTISASLPRHDAAYATTTLLQASFTVIINECPLTSVTADAATYLHNTAHTYEFDDVPLQLPLPTYSVRTPDCMWPVVYAVTITPDDGLITLTQTATHLEFSTNLEPANRILYTIQMTVTFGVGTPSDPTFYLPDQTDTMEFTVEVTDPCITTVFDSTDICQSISATIQGGTFSHTVDENLWTDSISNSKGSIADGLTLCGTRSYALTPVGSTNALSTYVWGSESAAGSTQTYSAAPTTSSQIGIYDYQCIVTLTLYAGSTIDSAQSVTIEISACVTANPYYVINPGTYLDETYTMYDANDGYPSPKQINLVPFDFAPCDVYIETITCYFNGFDLITDPIEDANSNVWLKQVGNLLEVYTVDLDNPAILGVNEIVCRSDLADPLVPTFIQSSSTAFELTMINPCESGTLHQVQNTPPTNYIGYDYIFPPTTTLTIQLDPFDFFPCEAFFTEEIACSADGLNLDSNPLVENNGNEWIKKVGSTLEVTITDYTNTMSQVKTITCYSSLTNIVDPSIISTVSVDFDLTVKNACLPNPPIHQTLAGTYPSVLEYTIYDAQMIITLDEFDYTPCQPMYTETITCTIDGQDLINDPLMDAYAFEWIKQVGNTVEVHTWDRSISTVSKLIICTSTLTNPEDLTFSQTAATSFTLNVINECDATAMTAHTATFLDLEVSVGGPTFTNTWLDTDFKDDASSATAHFSSDGVTFCGPRKYTLYIQLEGGSFAEYSTETFIQLDLVSSPKSVRMEATIINTLASEVGTNQCRLNVGLEDYQTIPEVTVQFQCKVNADPCILASLTIEETILESLQIQYKLGDPVHYEVLDEAQIIEGFTDFACAPLQLILCVDRVHPDGSPWMYGNEGTCSSWRETGFDSSGNACDDIVQAISFPPGVTARDHCCGACGGGDVAIESSSEYISFGKDTGQWEFKVYSADVDKIGRYTLSLSVKYEGIYLVKDQLNIFVEIVDPCLDVELTLLPNIMGSSNIEYTVGDALSAYAIADSNVIEQTIFIPCPTVLVFVTTVSGFEIDPDLFTYDIDSRVFNIYNEQVIKEGVYNSMVQVMFEGNEFSVKDTQEFKVTVINPCPDAQLILLLSPFTDTEYMLGQEQPLPVSFNLDVMAPLDISVNCGEKRIEFFHLQQGDLEDLFEVNRDNSTFIVNYSQDTADVGTYYINYLVYMVEYDHIEVESEAPFQIKVIEPPTASEVTTGIQENTSSNSTTEATEEETLPDEMLIFDYTRLNWESPEEIERLRVTRSTLSATGVLTIEFSKSLEIPAIYADLEVITSLEEDDNQLNSWLDLQISSQHYGMQQAEIDITSYRLEAYRDSTIVVTVEFDQPGMLSLDAAYPEVLNIEFHQDLYSTQGNQLSRGTTLEVTIPQQFSGEELVQLEEYKEGISAPIVYASLAQLALNLLVGSGLKHMWKAINVVQFIVFYQVWKINFPIKVDILLVEIKNLAFFEFFQDWVVKMLKANSDDCNPAEDEMCYAVAIKAGIDKFGSDSLQQNAGVFALAAVAMVGAVALTGILYAMKSMHAKIKTLYIKIKTLLFWNIFIRYVLQGTLKLQISAATVIVITGISQSQAPQVPDEENQENTRRFLDEEEQTEEHGLKYTSSITMLVLFNLMPLLFAFALYKHRYTLLTEKTKKAFGTLYQTVQPIGMGSLSYSIVFLLRRSLFVAVTFLLYDWPVVQSQIQVLMTLGYLAYILNIPKYETPLLKQMEVFNEIIFLMTNYQLIFFCQSWVPVKAFSYVLIFCVSVLLLTNLIVIITMNIIKIKQQRRLKKIKKCQTKILVDRTRALMKLDDCDKMNLEEYKRSSKTFKLRNTMIQNMRIEVTCSTRTKLKSILVMNDEKQIVEIDLKAMVAQMAQVCEPDTPEQKPSEYNIHSKRMVLESIEEEKSKYEDSSLERDDLILKLSNQFSKSFTHPSISSCDQSPSNLRKTDSFSSPFNVVEYNREEEKKTATLESMHIKAVSDITMWLTVLKIQINEDKETESCLEKLRKKCSRKGKKKEVRVYTETSNNSSIVDTEVAFQSSIKRRFSVPDEPDSPLEPKVESQEVEVPADQNLKSHPTRKTEVLQDIDSFDYEAEFKPDKNYLENRLDVLVSKVDEVAKVKENVAEALRLQRVISLVPNLQQKRDFSNGIYEEEKAKVKEERKLRPNFSFKKPEGKHISFV